MQVSEEERTLEAAKGRERPGAGTSQQAAEPQVPPHSHEAAAAIEFPHPPESTQQRKQGCDAADGGDDDAATERERGSSLIDEGSLSSGEWETRERWEKLDEGSLSDRVTGVLETLERREAPKAPSTESAAKAGLFGPSHRCGGTHPSPSEETPAHDALQPDRKQPASDTEPPRLTTLYADYERVFHQIPSNLPPRKPHMAMLPDTLAEIDRAVRDCASSADVVTIVDHPSRGCHLDLAAEYAYCRLATREDPYIFARVIKRDRDWKHFARDLGLVTEGKQTEEIVEQILSSVRDLKGLVIVDESCPDWCINLLRDASLPRLRVLQTRSKLRRSTFQEMGRAAVQAGGCVRLTSSTVAGGIERHLASHNVSETEGLQLYSEVSGDLFQLYVLSRLVEKGGMTAAKLFAVLQESGGEEASTHDPLTPSAKSRTIEGAIVAQEEEYEREMGSDTCTPLLQLVPRITLETRRLLGVLKLLLVGTEESTDSVGEPTTVTQATRGISRTIAAIFSPMPNSAASSPIPNLIVPLLSMGCMNSEPIPHRVLTQLCGNDRRRVSRVTERWIEFGLVSASADGQSLSVQPSVRHAVQKAVRYMRSRRPMADLPLRGPLETLDFRRIAQALVNSYTSGQPSLQDNQRLARELLVHCLYILEAHHLDVGEEVVDLRYVAACCHRDLGQHDEALEHLEQVAQQRRNEAPENSSALATVLLDIGEIHTRLGDPEKARQALDEAREALPGGGGGGHEEHIRLEAAYGDLRLQQGDIEGAKAGYHQALEALAMVEALTDPRKNFELHVRILTSLGSIDERSSSHALALASYNRALQIWQQNCPADHDTAVDLLVRIYRLHELSGDLDVAEGRLIEAYTMHIRLHGWHHPRTPALLSQIAELSEKLSRQHEPEDPELAGQYRDGVCRFAEPALSACLTMELPGETAISILHTLSRVYLNQNRVDDAVAVLRGATSRMAELDQTPTTFSLGCETHCLLCDCYMRQANATRASEHLALAHRALRGCDTPTMDMLVRIVDLETRVRHEAPDDDSDRRPPGHRL